MHLDSIQCSLMPVNPWIIGVFSVRSLSYYKYLGVANYARGNGKDYATNALPPGWQRIKGAIPQKGDILVYTSGGGGYGHVAIAESQNVSWHQNFNGKYVRKISGNYNTIHVGYWGVIRPVL